MSHGSMCKYLTIHLLLGSFHTGKVDYMYERRADTFNVSDTSWQNRDHTEKYLVHSHVHMF